ncbi:hypothetical protein QCA50_007414 [Cerrena zonata]|uniref:Uncharacterized protein n=1 Tax=Cerrena zonata TaxID=2478898 RepID=A0AAW0G9Y5_9APHY
MNSDAPLGSQGRKMMEDKLRLYLWWKGKLAERKQDGRTPFAMPSGQKSVALAASEISEALRRKDKERQARAANRRRVRGGGPSASSSSRDAGVSANSNGTSSSGHTGDNPESIAQFLASHGDNPLMGISEIDISLIDFGSEFDTHYGLVAPSQTGPCASLLR